VSLGVAGVGTYLPAAVRTAAEIAERSGIPEPVVREKFGIESVRVAGPDDQASVMATRAVEAALGGFPPEELDLLVYCGSEHKDYVVWSAAIDVARQAGAGRAAAFEVHALCAGTPIAIRTVQGMMAEDESIRSAVVVAAARENDLIDYANPRSRFMNNFGAGAGAFLLLRDHANPVVGGALLTDSRCSRDVVLVEGMLDVPDPEGMRERLDVSLGNFLQVGRRALRGRTPGFVALTHMKRSMHDAVLAGLGAAPEASWYLSETGHVQAADQALALEQGLRRGLVRPGQTVLLLAAGTGYTWAASAIEWEGLP
jgi:3-oxoacyl-[acyl-carrier-protein] synthase III